jgi:hypothetical protein
MSVDQVTCCLLCGTKMTVATGVNSLLCNRCASDVIRQQSEEWNRSVQMSNRIGGFGPQQSLETSHVKTGAHP